MTDKYILDGKTPVPCDDLLEWGRWLEDSDRRVAYTKTWTYRVSTVFLGLNHNFMEGEPLLFESMVFPMGGWEEQEMARYSTWDEAITGHRAMVRRLFQTLAPWEKVDWVFTSLIGLAGAVIWGLVWWSLGAAVLAGLVAAMIAADLHMATFESHAKTEEFSP
jgi:hypothetical protein